MTFETDSQGLLHKAAGVAEANSQHALELAQKLSQELRAAEDRIAQLEADVRYYQERTDRAEQWLHKIFTGIEERFFRQQQQDQRGRPAYGRTDIKASAQCCTLCSVKAGRVAPWEFAMISFHSLLIGRRSGLAAFLADRAQSHYPTAIPEPAVATSCNLAAKSILTIRRRLERSSVGSL